MEAAVGRRQQHTLRSRALMRIVTLTFVSRLHRMAPGMVSTRRVGGVAGAAGAGTAAMRPMLPVPQYEPNPESLFFLWDGGTWAWVQ